MGGVAWVCLLVRVTRSSFLVPVSLWSCEDAGKPSAPRAPRPLESLILLPVGAGCCALSGPAVPLRSGLRLLALAAFSHA